MDAWSLDDVEGERAGAGELYREFLRVESMSAGLYVLEAGAADPQTPHAQDEVYYVVSGRAEIDVAGETRPVQQGSVIFVGKGVEHRFHSIAERLELLVLFAPAEAS
jgi:mannose-6-phosphate isomerase-like protein (cupin superfamily)